MYRENAYFREQVEQIPPLQNEDIHYLVERYKTDNADTEALHKLTLGLLHWMRLICLSHHKHFNEPVDIEDLITSLFLAFERVVRRYKSEKKYSFKTFAEYRMRGTILDYVRNKCAFALNYNMKGTVPIVTHDEYEIYGGYCCTQDDIDSHYCHVPSLAVENNQLVEHLLVSLTAREKHILYMYYWKEKSQKDISKEYGVSIGRISQIRSEAILKLKDEYDHLMHVHY